MVNLLSNKTVVINGCSGYLGSAICSGLRSAGAEVIGLVSSAERFRTLDSAEFDQVIELDFSDDESFEDGLEKLAGQRVDCFVNNACSSAALDFGKFDWWGWKAGIDGALNYPSRMLFRMLPLMASPGGSIINIASMYGVVSPRQDVYEGSSGQYKGSPTYAVSKAAIIHLTKIAAVNLGDKGIRVNCISPGAFPRPEVAADEAFSEALIGNIPLKRLGMPLEMVGPVVFLASDLSSYMTGHNMVVDGGWCAQ